MKRQSQNLNSRQPSRAKLALTLAIALNLVVLPTPSWAASTVTLSSGEAELSRTLNLIQHIEESSPKSQKLSALRDRSIYLTEQTLNEKVQKVTELQAANPLNPEVTQLRNEITKLSATMVQDIRRKMQAQVSSSEFVLQDNMLQKQLTDVATKMLAASIPLPDQLLRDPSKPATADNIINLGLEMAFAPSTMVALEAPTHFRYRMSQAMNKAQGAGLAFSNQYMIYGIAMGIVAVAQWGMYYDRNPNAIQQLDHLLDPNGMAGFGAFMAVNHPITKLLNGLRNGTVPKSMIPYIGMAAGSLASSVFHDLWTDKEAHKCVKSMWLGSKQIDAPSCEKTFDTWAVHNKIMQYAPSIMSMLLSTQLAGVIRSSVVKAGSSDTAKVIFKGMRIMPKAARAATIAGSGGFTPAGITIAVGDFVLFIAIDAVLSGPINYYWEGFRIGNFNTVPWLNKMGFHREFWFPKAGEKQAISDALDVEATNLPAVHGYFVDLFPTLQAAGWKRPSKESCAPKDLDQTQPGSEILKQVEATDPAAAAFYPTGGQSKSSEQLRCEVLARPKDLLERYAKINQEWRTHLLSDFSSAQQNWMQTVAKFDDVLEATRAIGKYLAEEKWAVTTGQKTQVDLSRATLEKLIAKPAKEPDAEAPEKSNPTHFRNIQTPDLVDYVVASMACGAKGESLFRAPIGSNFEFLPPNLTTENGNVCRFIQSVSGSLARALKAPGHEATREVFNGVWVADDGKNYSSLADYIFDRMNPAVYSSTGQYSNFPKWWTENITDAIAPAWSQYEASYKALVNRSFTPVLFEKSYWSGCNTTPAMHGRGAKPEADKNSLRNEITDSEGFLVTTGPMVQKGKFGICKDGPVAYRAGNGVFLAIELETRNYLRGLYSIYASLFQNFKGPRKERGEFLTLANGLINSVRTLNAEHLAVPKSTEPDDGLSLNEADPTADTLANRMTAAQKTIESLVELMKTQMGAAGISQNDMRVELTVQLVQQLSQLVTEGQKYSEIGDKLSLESSTSRPADQSLNTPKSLGPLNRTGR